MLYYWQTYSTQIIGIVLLFIINNVIQFIPGLTKLIFDSVQHYAWTMKNTYIKGVLGRITDLTKDKVLMIEQTEIQYLRTQASEGKISKDQLPILLTGAKQAAIDAVKRDATAQGLWEMALKVFDLNEEALSKWLSDVVESHVSQLPSSGLQSVPASSKTISPAMLKAPESGGVIQPITLR